MCRRRIMLAGLLLLAAVGPTRSSARSDECPTTFTYRSYDIEGESLDTLRRSMRERGPVDEQGIHRYAETEWKVKWEWSRTEAGEVDPDTVTVRCDVVIILPRLADGNELSDDARASWVELLEKIKEHELQHARHIQTTAPRIERRLRERHERDGSVSVETANEIATKVVQEARELDRRYDADTDHGTSEGI